MATSWIPCTVTQPVISFLRHSPGIAARYDVSRPVSTLKRTPRSIGSLKRVSALLTFMLISHRIFGIAMAAAAVLSVWSCWNYIHGNIRSIRLF